MRHPNEFFIWSDPAIDWRKNQAEVLASGKMPKHVLMKDDNIFYLNRPSNDVFYLMIKHELSRGEAEFILHHNEY